MIRQKIGFGPNWPHLATEGGAKWGLKVKFSKIWLHHCSKLPKRSLPCEYGDDRAKNRIWPQLAPPGYWRGGAKWGLKVKFLKIWLHHCSKLPKRSLPCEYGHDRAKNRIWPRLAPFGTFRGAKSGLRVDFYQIWLQIHSKHASKSAWCEFGKNRFMGTHFLAITGPLELGKRFPFFSYIYIFRFQ